MSEVIRLEPKAENNCFGCGGGNDSGMRLAFDLLVDERAADSFSARDTAGEPASGTAASSRFCSTKRWARFRS